MPRGLGYSHDQHTKYQHDRASTSAPSSKLVSDSIAIRDELRTFVLLNSEGARRNGL